MGAAQIVELILGLEPDEKAAIMALIHLFHKSKPKETPVAPPPAAPDAT